MEIRLMDDYERVTLLVDILLNINARVDERDDAAMDLSAYDDKRALDALITVVKRNDDENFIMSTCGESIAEILVRQKAYKKEVVELIKGLNKTAKAAVEWTFQAYDPSWKLD